MLVATECRAECGTATGGRTNVTSGGAGGDSDQATEGNCQATGRQLQAAARPHGECSPKRGPG